MRRIAFSVEEFRELIPSYSKASIYRQLKSGQIRSTRIGNKIFIPREWIEEHFGSVGGDK